ncbi:unnamed protein product, partial [Ceratitis capitata]
IQISYFTMYTLYGTIIKNTIDGNIVHWSSVLENTEEPHELLELLENGACEILGS